MWREGVLTVLGAFVVRYRGFFTPNQNQMTFSVTLAGTLAQQNYRLYVAGGVVIDQWTSTPGSATVSSATVTLTSGTPADVVFDYLCTFSAGINPQRTVAFTGTGTFNLRFDAVGTPQLVSVS
jgi:hypothetical protein